VKTSWLAAGALAFVVIMATAALAILAGAGTI
jgi:hypothetical protein